MAYATQTSHGFYPALQSAALWVAQFAASRQAEIERHREYRRTLRELHSLSDRELDDLGLSRLSLRDVARAAAKES